MFYEQMYSFIYFSIYFHFFLYVIMWIFLKICSLLLLFSLVRSLRTNELKLYKSFLCQILWHICWYIFLPTLLDHITSGLIYRCDLYIIYISSPAGCWDGGVMTSKLGSRWITVNTIIVVSCLCILALDASLSLIFKKLHLSEATVI